MTTRTATLVRIALAASAALYITAPDTADAGTAESAVAYIYQPTTTSPWRLHSGHTFNSTGGTMQFTRFATGDYEFRIGNMSGFGNAQARAHGTSHRCKVITYSGIGSDASVRVRCITAAGAPVGQHRRLRLHDDAVDADASIAGLLRRG